MFPTFIGPTGLAKGYLRPETAQGIFVNFKRLLEYNQNKLPFACAQIGTSFRNEISPRQGLLRLREFQMAEVEHFLHPKDKSHPRFAQVSHVELHLLPREAQELAKEAEIRTIGEAVRSGMINSETLGYYIARTYLFLLRAGIKPDKVRFRQHLATEMAHYACDCWDAELLLASGWIECVGCADRSAYDLQRHSEFSDQQLMATERLDQPLRREVMFVLPNKALLGPLLGKRMTAVQKCLDELTVESKMAMQRQLVEQGTFVLSVAGEELELRPEMVSFKTEEQNVYDGTCFGYLFMLFLSSLLLIEHFTPHVIEPSFGISRLVYAILEQNFYLRDGDEPRAVLSFPPVIAPVAVTIFPLLNNKGFVVFIEKLSKEFRQAEVLFKVDDSNVNIGRRYVRADETGCAFGCTIDFDTLKDDTVTLRERDSMGQARLPISDVAAVVKALVQQKCTWEQLIKKYGLFVFAGDSR
ncbi:hypothetical protein Zmor_008910 [Zophobas morio]|uniref:glycine--tRNA ligase n=1 Tax=Zophobas morio TaxID=2755281 RepID=A0AA38HHA6_9CUCU|nr:hypothetical protein Zmor_008910 [Zophobas morio]